MSKLIGKKYGALLVLDAYTTRTSGGNPKRMLRVQCDCGKIFDRADKSIKKAKYPTCRECYTCETPKEFGNQHALYGTWAEMRRRCNDPRRPKYPHYGGRGITVCDRWDDPSTGFEAFVRDMGDKPSKRYTLDRIDNDGPYSPENCRWATPLDQRLNSTQPAPVFASLGGYTKQVGTWTRLMGVSDKSVRKAIKRGLTPEEALLNAIAHTL